MTAPCGDPDDLATQRCAPAAQRRGDQRYATAAPANRWLLIEQPGSWGRTALTESRLDRRVAAELQHRTARLGVRVQLIRRPGRTIRTPLRSWAYSDSRPGSEQLRWGTFGSDAELLELTLDGSDGEPSNEAAYLVCAHARHDTCCALRGRAVAAALAAQHPQQTWECSHLGGDRFAANLLVLPHGLYYGHVTTAAAGEIVRAYEDGRLEPTWLRGRSSLSPAAQAAQHHARLALEEYGLDALRPLEVAAAGTDVWRVRLERKPGDVLVTVGASVSPAAERLTCHSAHPETVRVFRLIDLQVNGDGPGPA